MAKALTTKERASRQRIMMKLRSWMEREGITRREIASEMGITEGHLRTLLNANRSASEAQCQKALILMDSKFAVSQLDPRFGEFSVKPLKKRKEARPEPRKTPPKPKPKAKKKAKKKKVSRLRSLTKFESKFLTDVAIAWVKANPAASRAELVDVVRALSIGIRS